MEHEVQFRKIVDGLYIVSYLKKKNQIQTVTVVFEIK